MPRRVDNHVAATPVETLDNGYLRCTGTLFRTGVYTYRRTDGSVYRELRLPEEVFDPDSLASFELVPVTNDHPSSELTSHNTASHQVGSLGHVRRDGDVAKAEILLTCQHTIEDAQRGKVQLSPGYRCDVEVSHGITRDIDGIPDGLLYDAIQRRIRANHVSVVHKGRGGDHVRLHLDKDDAIACPPIESQKLRRKHAMTTKRMTLDGTDYDVPELLYHAITQEFATLHANNKRLQAQADQAHAHIDTLQQRVDSLQDPQHLQDRIQRRIQLESQAKTILDLYHKAPLRLDAMSEEEIREQVLLHVLPDGRQILDRNDKAYTEARFDALVNLPPPPGAPRTPTTASTSTAMRRDTTVSIDELRHQIDQAEEARGLNPLT